MPTSQSDPAPSQPTQAERQLLRWLIHNGPCTDTSAGQAFNRQPIATRRRFVRLWEKGLIRRLTTPKGQTLWLINQSGRQLLAKEPLP